MEAYISASQFRSLQTIKTELEFLQSTSKLTSSQVSQILSILPSTPSAQTNGTHQPTPAISLQPTPSPTPTPSWNEKQSQQSTYSQQPPAYPSAPSHTPSLGYASALYAYAPADANDLALQSGDRVQILENMNADWARGRNERTGHEGIFPRSYVKLEEKGGMPPLPYRNPSPAANGVGYGGMPMEVANGANGQGGPGGPGQQGPNKFNEQGKKFGKKLGNAAVFGAGATIGSDLVNSIF